MGKKVIGVLVNDIHLNKDNGSLVKNIFRQIIKVCKDNVTDKIFCGGDVFTSRSGQPLSCLTDWKEILQTLTKKGIEFHVIPGNHDKTDADDEKSYLDVYSERCLHLYRYGDSLQCSNLCICFIPYFKDEKWLEEFNRVEEETRDQETRILITHMGFDGVRNNDGSQVESELKPSLFKKFTNVFIGHYHNASKLARNVFYTGSAYQNNYGETADDKGCTLIYSDGTFKHVSLKFPRYIKETIDVNDKESLRQLLEQYEGDDYNNIRIVFTGKKVEASKVDLSDLAARGIDAQFQAIESEEAIQASEDEAILNYDKKTLVKDFMKFCSENSIKGKHLKYGMSLIKSV